MTPLPAATALDQYFLEARSKLLDLAGIFDRLDRGAGSVAADPRLVKLRTALSLLGEPNPGRAERVQELFSLPYDAAWAVPAPK
jgi:hypothetical protein